MYSIYTCTIYMYMYMYMQYTCIHVQYMYMHTVHVHEYLDTQKDGRPKEHNTTQIPRQLKLHSSGI